jgi:L-iditol 2-dehydrogenase
MRAAVVPEPGRIEVREFPIPVARHDGDVVVRMSRASICGSDIHAVLHGFHNPTQLGRPGYPGHEGVGTIAESRSSRFTEGDVVLTVPIGREGGCFADYQLIPDTQLVALPAGGDESRLLMAQQYGTTLYAMRLFWNEDERRRRVAAIMGAGSAGLFFVQQVVALGFEHVIVSDLNTDRLSIAKRLGATQTVRAPDSDITAAVDTVTSGEGADLVIEAAGYDSLRAEAIRSVATLGTVGFFGYPERYGMAEFPMFDAFDKIVRIQWAAGTQSEPGLRSFRDAVEHIHSSQIEVDYCLTKSYPLSDVAEAFHVAERQGDGAAKICIEI